VAALPREGRRGRKECGVTRDLALVAGCLYAASFDEPLENVAASLGVLEADLRRTRKSLDLPSCSADMSSLWTTALVTELFRGRPDAVLPGIERLVDIINKLTSRIEKELDREKLGIDEIEALTELVTATAKLSAPVMFLYRDTVNPHLDSKVTKMLNQPWSQKLIDNLIGGM
jgi:hypothetical protein